MTLAIRSVRLANFRKFRKAVTIDGLGSGLNIVIEPNEAGKSTLLDALRAAFFIRHSTRGQLAQSYLPHGDAVGPEIAVEFAIGGAVWRVSKRFLRSPSIELDGPDCRAQGEGAEVRLQELLGAARDTSSRGDAAANGILGLLWVMQGDGLNLRAPGAMVRDVVHATLEGEVGAILGGAAYERVRSRVETQFGAFWTATGRVTGKQTAARERSEALAAAAKDAEARLSGLERNFADLDAARSRLKLLDRETTDGSDSEQRAELDQALAIARAAAQILATRRAEWEAAKAKLDSLEDLSARHEAATAERERLREALADSEKLRSRTQEDIRTARKAYDSAKAALSSARDARRIALAARAKGEALAAEGRQRKARDAARRRHAELLGLEHALEVARHSSAMLIPADAIEAIEAHERKIAEARATLDVGAVRVALEGSITGIAIDGAAWDGSERLLSRDARIAIGEGAVIVVRPPATAQSAEARLSNARESLAHLLAEWEIESLAAARLRNETARDAASEMRTIAARIESVTPADDEIGLAVGPDALKGFVAALAEDAIDENAAVSLADLAISEEVSARELARAEGAEQGLLESLRDAEGRNAPLAADAAAATASLANVELQLAAIEGRSAFAGLAAALVDARQLFAAASVQLGDAERNATVHEEATILRRIGTIDARVRVAGERRIALEMTIARLEAAIEAEGGKGLAEGAAAAREEAEAAEATLHRVTEEAAALKLLRDTLEEARSETSQSFVGPIAARAKRYIDRLLPASEPLFSDDLGIEAIVRGGISEECATLSRGTQEQLAILTRLAFAELLLEQGFPVSLILDDPLAYSDDARLETMTEILVDAAQRMQVIILTCRDRAFRHLPGTHLRIVGAE